MSRDYSNIEYGRAGDLSLRMDVRVPDGFGPFPAVIVVHGGAWVTGDRLTTVQPLFQPLTDAGFAWFSISYRLAGNGFGLAENSQDLPSFGLDTLMSLGTAIEDVRSAIRYVAEHAADYGADPRRIGIIGESAGAQLASIAVLHPATALVRAVVSFYGPMDLVALAKTSKQIPDAVRDSVRGTMWEEMLLSALHELSPINFVGSGAPPFLLIHGTQDALVPFAQSVEMREALLKAGAHCDLVPVRGGGHGIRWWEFEKLTTYKQQMITWLHRQLTSRDLTGQSKTG